MEWLEERSPFARGATVTAVPSHAFERTPKPLARSTSSPAIRSHANLPRVSVLAGSGIDLVTGESYFAFFFAVFFAAFFAVFFAAFFFAAMFVSPFLCFVFEVLLNRALACALAFVCSPPP